MKRHRALKVTLIAMTAVLILLSGAIIFYAADYYRAGDEANALLDDSPALVEIFRGGVAIGSPDADTGLIFYPGGKVEHTAYLPLLAQISEQGIFCVIVKMPLNLAVFDVNAANGIMKQYPSISSWFIGGHSLGGAMAASYADKFREQIDGLVLLAAYATADLADSGFPVLSIFGSEDGVLNREKLMESRSLMPPKYVEIEIVGGNHAQFGDYGVQAGDGQALISPAEQTEQTLAAIIDFIKNGGDPS